MAIKKVLAKDDNDYKVEFKDTYFKIDDVYVNTMKEKVRFGVRGYANEYAKNNVGIGVYKKNFEIDFSDLDIKSFSKNDILTAGYAYLKTLDEFKNGTDV